MTPITDSWLAEVGFKWHQFDRQPGKQWLLWLDCACIEPGGFKAFGEDLGIELAQGSGRLDEPSWYFCWLRADTSHRYSRFLHIRHLRYQEELISMIEGLTGSRWNPANNLNGAMQNEAQTARMRAEYDRIDKRMLRETPPYRAWREIEKDDTRGGALPEHMQGAIDGGKAK